MEMEKAKQKLRNLGLSGISTIKLSNGREFLVKAKKSAPDYIKSRGKIMVAYTDFDTGRTHFPKSLLKYADRKAPQKAKPKKRAVRRQAAYNSGGLFGFGWG